MFNFFTRFSLVQYIFASAFLGIIFGLYFGEKIAQLSFFGEMFIRLIQMTLIPYIVVSLIKGFASLTAKRVSGLVVRLGVAYLLIYFVTLTVIYLLPFSFPNISFASFYSTTTQFSSERSSLLDVLIPTNPIASMVNNAVPAIVLFCICIGISLINVKNKEQVISLLSSIEEALENLTYRIYYFAPIGIFSLMATEVAQFKVQKILTIQVFVISYIAGSLLLTFVVIPSVVTSLLPITYRELFRLSRSVLLLAFSTASAFITMPMQVNLIKNMYEKKVSDDSLGDVPVIVPIIYNFPTSGVLLNVLFVYFGAWIFDKQLGILEQAQLIFLSAVNFFSDSLLGISFLLDHFHLPSDYFSIFVTAQVITAYFETLADAMGMLAVAMIYMGVVSGTLKISLKKIAYNAIIAATATLLSFLCLYHLFNLLVWDENREKNILMEFEVDRMGVDSVVYRSREEVPSRNVEGGDLLETIKKSRVLKVGYNTSSMPFAYFNNRDELVGYDVQMAYELANLLKVGIEFIPFGYDSLVEDLKKGVYDIAMSSVTMSDSRMQAVSFSNPYMALHLAFIVLDYRRGEFKHLFSLKEKNGLRIAIMQGSAYREDLKNYFPLAEIVELSDMHDFFTLQSADAFVMTAEQGYAWTLLYPNFSVITFDREEASDLIGYPVGEDGNRFLYLLNQRISMRKESGEGKVQYDKWVLGNVINN